MYKITLFEMQFAALGGTCEEDRGTRTEDREQRMVAATNFHIFNEILSDASGYSLFASHSYNPFFWHLQWLTWKILHMGGS